MLEIPECRLLAKQLEDTVKGKTIKKVAAAAFPHGFAFYFGDPAGYDELLSGRKVTDAKAYAGHMELEIEEARLVFNDGVNVRYVEAGGKRPAKHQLLIEFDDETAIFCTIQMYGAMCAFLDGENENPYYLVAKEKPSPLSEAFDENYFNGLIGELQKPVSAKALLATEQRIPGLGNGVLQDILFNAQVHPKTKTDALSDGDMERLFKSVKGTLSEMCRLGCRDTEKDIFGNVGKYSTILSKNTYSHPCPSCGGSIVRQAFLGGNVYFCPTCQPYKKH